MQLLWMSVFRLRRPGHSTNSSLHGWEGAPDLAAASEMDVIVHYSLVVIVEHVERDDPWSKLWSVVGSFQDDSQQRVQWHHDESTRFRFFTGLKFERSDPSHFVMWF